MACPLPFPALLDDLHRRHDGPPPAHAVRVALLGGRLRADALAREATQGFHQRSAAEARLGAARRRSALAADAAITDAWLVRLAATLAHHRHEAQRSSGTGHVGLR